MEGYLKQFNDFVSNYDCSKEFIKLKVDHSIRVAKTSLYIAKELNLSVEDQELAFLIGLVHDYGRFEQLKIYDSFDDIKTIDHGDYGVKLLFEEGYINSYGILDKYHTIIKDAVKNHNKYSIDPSINIESLLMCKIIRDADKIDIYYLLSKGELPISKGKFTDDVIKDLANKKSVNNENLKEPADKYLVNLGLIYDLNFDCSFKYLKENKYVEKFISKYKNNNSDVRKVENDILKYVCERGDLSDIKV